LFLKGVKSQDTIQVKKEVSKIPHFVNGYILLSEMIKDPKIKSLWASEIVNQFPSHIPALKSAASIKETLGEHDKCIEIGKMIEKISPNEARSILIHSFIRSNKIKEAQRMLDDDSKISDLEKAIIGIESWKIDGDEQKLRDVISLPNSDKITSYKAQAVFYLGNLIDVNEAESIFVEQLKLDKKNPDVYSFYGKYKKNILKDEEKGNFLLKKAVEYGSLNDDEVELYTRDLIANNEFEKAIEFCGKIDTKWSHLRAGLSAFRLGKFTDASLELQAHIKKDPRCKEAWVALAFTYYALGKIMSVVSVNERLVELGHQDMLIQNKIDSIYGKPCSIRISNPQEFRIKETPLIFQNFLIKSIENIRWLRRFSRKECAISVVNDIEPLLVEFVEKWDHLSAVLKQAGDFYVEAFTLTEKEEFIDIAQEMYMKRAEKDKRGESLIDVAIVLHIKGMSEKAVGILKRAVKAFPDNHAVWLNLGIGYAIIKQFQYARHCLCVAEKLSTAEMQASIFSCYAAISILFDNKDEIKLAIDKAYNIDPENPEVWELKMALGEVSPYAGGATAFENGPNAATIDVMTEICIKENKPLEAIGFAMMSGNKKKIEMAFEANKQYEYAMLYADDEETKQRLIALSRGAIKEGDYKDTPLLNAVFYFTTGDYDKASEIFIQRDDIFSVLGAAACVMKKGKANKAAEVIKKQIEKANSPVMKRVLDSLAMTTDPECDTSLPDSIIGKLRQGIKLSGLLQASYLLYNEQPNLIAPMKLFIIEGLRASILIDQERYALDDATKNYLKRTGKREALLFRSMFLMKYESKNRREAMECLQKLCILSPSLVSTILPIIQN
jgi:superkiller protein 3